MSGPFALLLKKRFTWLKKLIIALLIGAASLPATAERIRDLVTVQGRAR